MEGRRAWRALLSPTTSPGQMRSCRVSRSTGSLDEHEQGGEEARRSLDGRSPAPQQARLCRIQQEVAERAARAIRHDVAQTPGPGLFQANFTVLSSLVPDWR